MTKKPKHEDSAPDDDLEPMMGTEAEPPLDDAVPVPVVADPKARLQALADDLNYQGFHNGPVPPHMVRELYDIAAALKATPKE